MQINKKKVILSVSFLYGICVNLIYRPFVYQNHLNDFGIADIGNNLTFIPVVYFISYFLKKGYRYSKYLDLIYCSIIFIIGEFLSYLFPVLGQFDFKDIIGLLIGTLIVFIVIKNEK